MSKLLLALLTTSALLAGGCCGAEDLRYWRVKDLSSGRTFYAADTVGAPITRGAQAGPVFVSSEGRLVGLSSFEMERVDEVLWGRESGARASSSWRWVPGGGSYCYAVVVPGIAVESVLTRE